MLAVVDRYQQVERNDFSNDCRLSLDRVLGLADCDSGMRFSWN